jgi:hypothetical protein
LSGLLASLDAQDPDTAALTQSDIKTVARRVRLLVAAAALAPRIEAYRLATFALLAVHNSSQRALSELERQNLALRGQIAELHAERPPGDIGGPLEPIRAEFAISAADSVRSLEERVRSLEEANRAKEVELERLRSDSPAAGLGPEELARAVELMSDEVSRMIEDRANEAAQRARLIAIVQKQAAALGFLERQAPVGVRPSRATEKTNFLCTLKSAIDEAFPDGAFSTDTALILADCEIPPSLKCTKLFAFLKMTYEKRLAQLTEANQRLKLYVANLVNFLNEVATNRSVQNWALDAPPDEDFRARIVAQLTRISEFFHRVGVQLDTMPLCKDISQLAQVVRVSPDPEQLSALIPLLATICDVMRKFTEDVYRQKELILVQASELRREGMRRKDAEADVCELIETATAQATAEATAPLKCELREAQAALAEKERVIQEVSAVLVVGPPSQASESALRIIGGRADMTVVQSMAQSLDRAALDLKAALAERDAVIAERNAALAERDAASAKSAGLAHEIAEHERDLELAAKLHGRLDRQLFQKNAVIDALQANNRALHATCNELKQAAGIQREKFRHDMAQYQAQILELECTHNAELRLPASKLEENTGPGRRASLKK